MPSTLLPKLMRRGLRKGLLEGSRPWMAVGVVAGALAIVRRAVRNEPEKVATRRLEAGEGLIIRVREPVG